MGFWSTLTRIGGYAAAPFTGGASVPIANAAAGAIDAYGTAKTANNAAAIQSEAGRQSNVLLDTAQTDATGNLRGGQEQAYGALLPYAELGANSSTQLNQLMDPNSEFSKGFQGQLNTPEFTPPNPQDVLNNPAIQLQLQQGEKAIQRGAANRGGLLNPATSQHLNTFAQGVASQGYNDLFSHAQQTWQDQYQKALTDFNSAYGIYQDTRNSRLGLLNTALQSGQNASSQNSNNAILTGSTIARNQLGIASEKGGNLQGAANATAAGKVKGAEAWNQFGDNLGTSLDLYNLNKNAGRTPPYVPNSSSTWPSYMPEADNG